MTESDAQISPPAAEAKPKPKGGAGKLIALFLTLVVIAALGAAAFLAWPRVEALLASDTQQLDSLRQELAATRAQLADLANRPAPAPAADPEIERRLATLEKAQPAATPHLAEEVKALSDGLTALQKTAADAAAVLRLADRLAKVEGELREVQARRSSAAAQLLAIGQLRAAIDQALPYDAEWRAVKALAPDDAEAARLLAVIKPQALSGIPARATLIDRFGRLEPAIIRAEALPEGDSWWRQALNRLMTVVTIRREDGEAGGDGAAAIVARVRTRLAGNDFAAAIAEAERLTEGPADTAKIWLDDTRARLAADQALSELTAQAVAAIGARQ